MGPDRVTFDDAAQDLINDYTTNGKRSIAVCRRRVTKHLAPFFGDKRDEIVSPEMRTLTRRWEVTQAAFLRLIAKQESDAAADAVRSVRWLLDRNEKGLQRIAVSP